MTKSRRGNLFVDPKVQGALTVRVAAYWMYCLITVTMMMFCWTIFLDQPRSSSELLEVVWSRSGPALLTSVLLLPIVLIDCIRLSNRFVGPIVRLRRAMKELAEGHPTTLVTTREGDFWHEFAEDFNRVIVKVQGSAVDAETSSEENLTKTV